jgi:hypothetical protein
LEEKVAEIIVCLGQGGLETEGGLELGLGLGGAAGLKQDEAVVAVGLGEVGLAPDDFCVERERLGAAADTLVGDGEIVIGFGVDGRVAEGFLIARDSFGDAVEFEERFAEIVERDGIFGALHNGVGPQCVSGLIGGVAQEGEGDARERESAEKPEAASAEPAVESKNYERKRSGEGQIRPVLE